jgi:hypothetical protein
VGRTKEYTVRPSWEKWGWTDQNTSVSGALVVFRGSVYMAYNGMRGDDGIYYATFDRSASTEPKKVQEPASTNTRLALTTWNDSSNKAQKLVLAWKESDKGEILHLQRINPTATYSQAASAYGPALTFFRRVIYAAWRGPGEDERIWYSSYNDTSWT